MFKNSWIFCKRELKSYFNSPVAYIVITIFLLISGWFFFNNLFIANQADFQGLFSVAPFIFMFFAPAISMRLISEEKRSGTMEILVTLPVKDWEVVLGKYLSALILLSVAILLTLTYTLTLSTLGNLDEGALVGGYLGLIMVGATYLSVGIFTSSLTKNQVVAFVLSFVIVFILFMLDKVVIFFPGFLAGFLEYLSVEYHFSNIARGVIDSRDIIYYLSVISFFILLAVRSLESRKWR
ncbi:MAG: ABC transporter permease [candidate division Zixibacteria bacterium]|nr:ABC transporter permease [candidate division Zixibacteria bacterium]